MESYAATDRLMGEAFHCPARRFDGDALLELEPALKPGPGRRLVLSRRCPPPARQADDRLAAASSRAGGVTIRENCALRGLSPARTAGPRPSNTAQGELAADVVRRRHRRLDAAARTTISAAACRSSRARGTA